VAAQEVSVAPMRDRAVVAALPAWEVLVAAVVAAAVGVVAAAVLVVVAAAVAAVVVVALAAVAVVAVAVGEGGNRS